MQIESAPSAEADIYIVGLGLVAVQQITKEVDAAIRRSNEVLYLDISPGVAAYLKHICPRATSLYSCYKEGEARTQAYKRMVTQTLAAALDHPPVSMAFYGHPLVYALPPFLIVQVAPLLGLTVKTFPGVSALDCLLVDLGLDPATHGLQMYEATDLLLRQRPLQPDVPCLLWQVGTVESSLFSRAANEPGRFIKIRDYLLRFYPPEHRMKAVNSASEPFQRSTFREFALKDIDEQREHLHQGLTLYIPPVEWRPVADDELLKQLLSAEQLHLGINGQAAKSAGTGASLEGQVAGEQVL